MSDLTATDIYGDDLEALHEASTDPFHSHEPLRFCDPCQVHGYCVCSRDRVRPAVLVGRTR